MTSNEILAEIDALRNQIESNMREHRQLAQDRAEAKRHGLRGTAIQKQNEMALLVAQRSAYVGRIYTLRKRLKERNENQVVHG